MKLKIPPSLNLIVCLMTGNLLNFLFNAVLGRMLSFEEFGLLTLFITLWTIIGVFLNALGATINHKVSYLFSRNKKRARIFYQNFLPKITIYGIFFTAAWIILAVPLAKFFNVKNITEMVFFSPSILIGILLISGKGYFQGTLDFNKVALVTITEPVAKLASAMLLSGINKNLVYLSIPISITVSLILFYILTSKEKINIKTVTKKEITFPKAFFGATLLAAMSTYAFAVFDVLLAKHFLSENQAGVYALLSLVGKMVFFFGSILNTFIITYVSRVEGLKKKTRSTFNILLITSIFLTITSFTALGPLGEIFVPILLGPKASAIIPYLTTYTLATALFTIANTLITYHLAKKQYVFSFIALFMATFMVIGIFISHQSVFQITKVFLIASFFEFITVCLLHLVYDYGKYILKNFIDFLDLFEKLPQVQRKNPDGKRVLIFNWRDTKHINSGGAETYIHEISKRWVKEGYEVTLFCGNDGKSEREEIINGVQVIRRGGFYTVYFWAFLYYLFQFRKKYDCLIDCQNGVPFFTPLYANIPVYCVIYHVHEDIFKKYLWAPLALVASLLEKFVMPRAYKHSYFITISDSTKKEMLEIGLKGKGIEIVHSGVDLINLTPGEKASYPTVLYLGRLKAYKSVDVLIKAFKKVKSKVPDARLVIAGSGEEEKNLKNLTRELGINKNVEFKGKVTEKEKVKLYQKAWVFVNPSMKEGWGITTIEANACGTPVVASDVSGLRDSVNNPHTGYLVEYGNINKFSQKIKNLIRDEKLSEKMSKNAVVWANRFSWKKSASQFASFL